MDLSDARTFALFLEIYGTLPRAGPGSTEDTLRALHMLPNQTPRTVLDLGCGPGAQTLVLAEALPDAEILAVDLTPSMATEAARRCTEAETEIEMFRRFSEYYSYGFFVVRPENHG